MLGRQICDICVGIPCNLVAVDDRKDNILTLFCLIVGGIHFEISRKKIPSIAFYYCIVFFMNLTMKTTPNFMKLGKNHPIHFIRPNYNEAHKSVYTLEDVLGDGEICSYLLDLTGTKFYPLLFYPLKVVKKGKLWFLDCIPHVCFFA